MRCHCHNMGSLLWCCIPIIDRAVVMFPYHNMAPATRRGYHHDMMGFLSRYGTILTSWARDPYHDTVSLSLHGVLIAQHPVVTQPPCHDMGPSELYRVPTLNASAPVRAAHDNRTWMSRQNFHVMMPSLRCNRTFMPRYNLYITQPPPSCRNTIFMSRQDLCVTVLSSCRDRARPSSGAAGIRTPSLWECHHQRLLLFFGRFFWPQGEKQNLRQRRSLRKRKPGPGGGGGKRRGCGFWGEIGGNLRPPRASWGPPPGPDPFSAGFLPNLGAQGGAGMKPGGPRAPLWDTAW